MPAGEGQWESCLASKGCGYTPRAPSGSVAKKSISSMFLLKGFLSIFVEFFRAYARMTVAIVWFFSSLPGAFVAIPWLCISFVINNPSVSMPVLSVPGALLLALYSLSIAHFALGSLALYYINEYPGWKNWAIAFLPPEFVLRFLGGPDEKRMHNRRVVIVPILFFAMFVVSSQGIGLFLHTS